jgi:hypothetical protein
MYMVVLVFAAMFFWLYFSRRWYVYDRFVKDLEKSPYLMALLCLIFIIAILREAVGNELAQTCLHGNIGACLK